MIALNPWIEANVNGVIAEQFGSDRQGNQPLVRLLGRFKCDPCFIRKKRLTDPLNGGLAEFYPAAVDAEAGPIFSSVVARRDKGTATSTPIRNFSADLLLRRFVQLSNRNFDVDTVAA
jgi:hypothetical protein